MHGAVAGKEKMTTAVVIADHPGHGSRFRDAVHGAAMQWHGTSTVIAFDRGFAGLPGISILAH